MKLTAREKRANIVQVLREALERAKKSPHGNDCSSALAMLEGVLEQDWPELAAVINELREFGRETERKRGWI